MYQLSLQLFGVVGFLGAVKLRVGFTQVLLMPCQRITGEEGYTHTHTHTQPITGSITLSRFYFLLTLVDINTKHIIYI